jgi:hypothetical protein
VAHKVSIEVKHFASIIKKYHGVYSAVNNKKGNKKQAGKPHCKLLAYRRSKNLFKGHCAKVIG